MSILNQLSCVQTRDLNERSQSVTHATCRCKNLCYYLVSAKVSPAGQSTAQNKLGTVLSMNQCITAIRNCRHCPVLNKLETINSYRIKQLCTTRGFLAYHVANSILAKLKEDSWIDSRAILEKLFPKI